MAIINLTCEHCGGNIVLDDSHEIGTCENCFSQFIVKEDKVTQEIVQNITKYVYGYEGKDVEELLLDGYKLLDLGNNIDANKKFRKAIDIDPDCWSAWLGYAETGGRKGTITSVVNAYANTYNVAETEQQQLETYVSMLQYIPEQKLRAVFVRAYNMASKRDRYEIFKLVLGVIGCDDLEITRLAVDLSPNDWRAYYVMGKFRIIRVKWCELEGNFFTGKHLPQYALEVLEIFRKAYKLAKNENAEAEMLSYFDEMEKQGSYAVFIGELKKNLG